MIKDAENLVSTFIVCVSFYLQFAFVYIHTFLKSQFQEGKKILPLTYFIPLTPI